MTTMCQVTPCHQRTIKPAPSHSPGPGDVLSLIFQPFLQERAKEGFDGDEDSQPPNMGEKSARLTGLFPTRPAVGPSAVGGVGAAPPPRPTWLPGSHSASCPGGSAPDLQHAQTPPSRTPFPPAGLASLGLSLWAPENIPSETAPTSVSTCVPG